MTLNGVMAVILHYFSKFGSFQLQSGIPCLVDRVVIVGVYGCGWGFTCRMAVSWRES